MQYIVNGEDVFVGERIDKFLSEQNEEFTRSYIQKLIEEENIDSELQDISIDNFIAEDEEINDTSDIENLLYKALYVFLESVSLPTTVFFPTSKQPNVSFDVLPEWILMPE